MRLPTLTAALLFLPLLACQGSDRGGPVGDDTAVEGDTEAGAEPVLVSEESSVSLLPEGQLNHLLPVRVALDPPHRRAWSVGNGLTTLAEVDLDTKTLTGVYNLGAVETSNLHIYVDGLGVVWLVEISGDPVLRVDPDTHEVTHPAISLAAVDGAVALADGGLIASSAAEDRSGSTLVWLDPDGAEVGSLSLDGAVIGLAQGEAGEIGVLTMQDLVTTLVAVDVSTREVRGSCTDPAGMVGLGGFAEMSSIGHGNYVATEDHAIATMTCSGAAWNKIAVGEENRSAIWADGALIVLDRIGPTAAQNPNWGVARRYDADLNLTGHAFQTGKNSGYGAYDLNTDRIWMNSEGTSELWSYEPSTGTLDASVRLGAHVESVIADPNNPQVLWFTGRLWNTVGRVDLGTGAVLTATGPFVWPITPVYTGGRLWVYDHVLHTIYGLNPDTLEVEVSAALDLTDNITLTFDDLVWDADRGVFFVSASRDNLLLELSGETGEELARWALAGDPVADPNLPGRLEVLPDGDEILVVRDNDGVVSVINPDTGELRTGQLEATTVGAMQRTLRLSRVTLSPDGTWFWAGADAYDLDTLTHDADRDLNGTYAIGPLGDGMLVYDDVRDAISALDATGEILASAPLAPDPRGEPAFQLLETAQGPRLSFGRFSTAEVVGWAINPDL